MIHLTTEERNKYKNILGNYNMLTALIKILDIEINTINVYNTKNDIVLKQLNDKKNN